jgi:hypothetical protein
MRHVSYLVLLVACGDNARGLPAFVKHTIDGDFRSEAAAVFDVDRDGVNDIVTDQFWYRGPDFVDRVEIRTPEIYDVNNYSHDVGSWGDDLDGDGWTDLVVAPYAADEMYWYRNPQGTTDHWERFLIAPPLSAGIEMPVYADLFGTGQRVAIMGIEDPGVVAWFAPPSDPTQPWQSHAISATGFGGSYRYAHGLGTGDVNGDGLRDVLTSTAWFEQVDPDHWVQHPLDLGEYPCSTMFAHDLDDDRLPDLLCAHPHSYGLEWWKQHADGTFTGTTIDDSISQMHSMGFADLDADGVPEIVTGKNFRAHPYGYGDPGDDDPVVLAYWTYEAGRFTRHDIDDDSGVGRLVTITDIDRDDRVDLVIASKKGLFWFEQR